MAATNMILESEAVTISGDGQFVLSGDMDFHLKFSLPADTAKGTSRCGPTSIWTGSSGARLIFKSPFTSTARALVPRWSSMECCPWGTLLSVARSKSPAML